MSPHAFVLKNLNGIRLWPKHQLHSMKSFENNCLFGILITINKILQNVLGFKVMKNVYELVPYLFLVYDPN